MPGTLGFAPGESCKKGHASSFFRRGAVPPGHVTLLLMLSSALSSGKRRVTYNWPAIGKVEPCWNSVLVVGA